MVDTAVVTLDEVRTRFAKAEAVLLELAESLSKAQSAGERLENARSGITGATEQLTALVGDLHPAAGALASGVELMRQGIAALEKSEPGQLLAELSRFSGIVEAFAASLPAAIQAEVNRLEAIGREENRQLRTTVEEGQDRMAQSMAALRDEHAAVLKEIAAVKTAVMPMLEALARVQREQTDALQIVRGEMRVEVKRVLVVVVVVGMAITGLLFLLR